MIDEGLLHWMQLAIPCEAFNGGYFTILDRDRKREARQHAPAIEQNRACAALAMVATLLRPCQADVVAKCVEQRRANVESKPVILAVDLECDLGWRARIRTDAGRRRLCAGGPREKGNCGRRGGSHQKHSPIGAAGRGR
jgi:hypothetical protein